MNNRLHVLLITEKTYTWKINDPKSSKINTISQHVVDTNTYPTNNEEHQKGKKYLLYIFYFQSELQRIERRIVIRTN